MGYGVRVGSEYAKFQRLRGHVSGRKRGLLWTAFSAISFWKNTLE